MQRPIATPTFSWNSTIRCAREFLIVIWRCAKLWCKLWAVKSTLSNGLPLKIRLCASGSRKKRRRCMRHDVQKHLLDILAAANDIQQFVGTQSYDEYHANKLVKAAVERKFEVIGEALSRIARLSTSTAVAIREYEKIIAFRNVVI